LQSSEQIKEFFEKLEYNAKIFDSLSDSEHDFWKEKPECIEYIEELKILDSKVFKILAMSIYEKMPTEIHKLLNICSVISLRYYIADKNPNEIEKLYSEIAIKVSKGEITRFSRVKELLKELYIKDDLFINNFSNRIIRSKSNKTRLKHIFIKIESNIEEKDIANSTKLSIEHILPENYSGEWNTLFNNNATDYIYRLGNYTLLTNTDNRSCGAKDFDRKKSIYANSRYKLSQQISELPSWEISTLQQRQIELAEIAKNIWRVDFN